MGGRRPAAAGRARRARDVHLQDVLRLDSPRIGGRAPAPVEVQDERAWRPSVVRVPILDADTRLRRWTHRTLEEFRQEYIDNHQLRTGRQAGKYNHHGVRKFYDIPRFVA